MMIRVGAVNIDTSHPMGFADAMAETGRMGYVGVYNDSFRSDAEVDGFIKRYGLAKRCQSLEELADLCDIGFVQGCNWDDHLRCVLPFLQKGKPVFIDKPMAGNLADCKKLEALARDGAVLLGSSSARYAFEIQDFLAKPLAERGEIVQVYGTAGVDEFNYGIHIAEAIGGLLGQGAEAVRFTGRGQAAGSYSENYTVRFAGGQAAAFTTFTGAWQPFVITVMTTKSTYVLRLDSNRLYAALMEQIANRLEGKPTLMPDMEGLTESVKIMLAAAASRAQRGESVALTDLQADGPCYDGTAFWKAYGGAAGPLYAV